MAIRTTEKRRLPCVALGDIEPMSEGERWLIDGLLSRTGLLVLASAPKTGKTWFTLSMAIAVASGRAALGRFDAREPGRVLVYPAEDDVRVLRSRVEGLCRGMDLEAAELPIDLITADRLHLDNDADRELLEAELEVKRPKMLVLDPFVRLHTGPESSVSHVSEVMGYLRSLQRRFEVAIVVTHHVRKNRSAKETQPGQALRGSGDLHASYDHGGLLERTADGRIVLWLEHRAAPTPDPMAFRLVSASSGSVFIEEVAVGEGESAPARSVTPRGSRPRLVHEGPLTSRVLNVLRTREVSVSQVTLRRELRVRNQALTDALRELVVEGDVEHLGRMKGWRATKRGDGVGATGNE